MLNFNLKDSRGAALYEETSRYVFSRRVDSIMAVGSCTCAAQEVDRG
jgi:hypothetical protein